MIRRRKVQTSAASYRWPTILSALFCIVLGFKLVSCHAVKTRLTWINGIGHTLAHMQEGQAFISARFGGKSVEWCHNPTAMAHGEDWRGYIGDLTQATTQKMGKVTVEVETLVKHLRKAIQSVGKRGVVVHISHSQGALITALACKQLTPFELSRLDVICFGGAACLQKRVETPFRRCMNYYAVNDPLLLLNSEALQALRSGFLNDEFCFLSPRLGDPILDHALLNPTYAQALEWEGARFERLYVTIMSRLWRRIWHILIAAQALLASKIIETMKPALKPVIEWCIVKARVIQERAWKPFLAVLLLFAEWLMHLLQRDQAKYVPVSSALHEIDVVDPKKLKAPT
jgi:hypothetical protein